MKGLFMSFLSHSKMSILLSIVVIAALLSTVGVLRLNSPYAALAASGDWPTYLFSIRRIGFNTAETIINPTTAPHLKLNWTHSTGAASTEHPVEVNSLIYWGSWDELEHATNLSGTDVWTTNLGTSTATCSTTTGVGS